MRARPRVRGAVPVAMAAAGAPGGCTMGNIVAAVSKDEHDPVRLGVVGAGWFASRRHLPDARANPQVHLSALCRRDPAACAKMAAHFQVDPEHTYADWRQMLEDAELDAVLIATPHALHYE